MCVRSSPDYEVITIGTRVSSKVGKRHRVGEWFGVEHFDGMEGTGNRICSNPGLEPCTEGFIGLSEGVCQQPQDDQFQSYNQARGAGL